MRPSARTHRFGFTDATHFTGSYVMNGQTIDFTGLLPTTYEYMSDQQKQEFAVDIAWDSINKLQMPSTPGGSVPIPIQIDTAIPTATGGITASGGGYITPANNPASVVQSQPITATAPATKSAAPTVYSTNSGYTIYGVPTTVAQTAAINNLQTNYTPYKNADAAISAYLAANLTGSSANGSGDSRSSSGQRNRHPHNYRSKRIRQIRLMSRLHCSMQG